MRFNFYLYAFSRTYVQRELSNIPSDIPVLVLANKIDLISQRQSATNEQHRQSDQSPSNQRFTQTVSIEDCLDFIDGFERYCVLRCNGNILTVNRKVDIGLHCLVLPLLSIHPFHHVIICRFLLQLPQFALFK
jgi:hypothetical protein